MHTELFNRTSNNLLEAYVKFNYFVYQFLPLNVTPYSNVYFNHLDRIWICNLITATVHQMPKAETTVCFD